ncbi:MAG: glycosyl hydrolase, partial [Acidobacteriota bacterium]
MNRTSSKWVWLALVCSLGLCLMAGARTVSAQPAPGAGEEGDEARMTAATFAGLELRNIGPALTSGRIADIAVHPEDASTWYVAVGSGGVWKTTDKGTTWTPIFDDQGSYSIGCVTIDPSRPDVIWVGTGENVSGRHVGYGDGVYRSRDGGRTWENVGLKESEHVAKILVDPRDSNTVYVAAEGPLWSAGGERGVFKSTDGGGSWTAVLEIGEDTGVTDLEFDPADPDTLYAAAYQRRRTVWAHLAGGPESGIYKSTDAGATWREVTTGLPSGDMGKIGLAVSPLRPEVVYATIEASEDERGFYRSADAGESWEKRSSYTSGGTGPHYYQEIYADPHRFDRVYQMDVWIHVTDDGGATFERLGEPYKHSDNHALAFVPDDPDYLLAGCDGGLYESWNRGASWSYVSNLPVTQIYKMALDDEEPFYNVVGGTQDNGTIYGPSRTDTVHGIMDRDWTVPYGADGYACGVDPTNPDVLYVTWQGGNLLRYDRKTGEALDVKPIPGPDDPPERWNWDAPFLISPHAPERLYLGSQRLWRSDDRGESWTPVSGDLTRAENRYELPMDEIVPGTTALYDNGAMSWYATTTAIAESPLVEGLLYVGTDDGLIQVSEDGGETWRRVGSVAGVPERSFVNDLRASVHDPDTVFAVLDNHKQGDFRPYLVKSTDRGRTWTSVAGDLPERQILWAVVQDHEDPDLLFAAGEYGLWFTADGGARWLELSGGVPNLAFRDLEIQTRENDLVGASFGRGFFVLDDYRALRGISEEALSEEALLFPVRAAELYVPRVPLRVREKGYLGATFYTAPNPPFGAVFTYYLREGHETEAEARTKREAELREEREDVPFPGWEALRDEQMEEGAQIVLTVTDADGAVVRRITGRDGAGMHRVAWDLRYPSTLPTRLEEPEPSLWAEPPAGPFVTPGTYRVELGRMIDGELEPLAGPETFRVDLLRTGTLPPEDRREVLAFQQRTDELQRKITSHAEVIGEIGTRLQLIEKALLQTPDATPELMQRADRLETRLADVRRRLLWDPVRGRLDEPTVPTAANRVQRIVQGLFYTTSGPT